MMLDCFSIVNAYALFPELVRYGTVSDDHKYPIEK